MNLPHVRVMVTRDPRRVAAFLRAADRTPLLVDAFPRGLAGELIHILPGRRALTALMVRALNPRYWRECRLRDFIHAHYDIVFKLSDPAWPAVAWDELKGRAVAPVTYYSRNEIADRQTARAMIGLPPEAVAVLNLTDRPLRRQLPRQAIIIEARRRPEFYPWGRWLRAFDLVVSAGGYNAWHEIRLADVPAIFLPEEKKYDLQAERVARGRERRRVPANGAEQIARVLARRLGFPRETDRSARRQRCAGGATLAGKRRKIRPRKVR